MLEKNKVYCGDCLEPMKQIPDKSIDLIFADPPFNAGGKIGLLDKRYDNYGDNKTTQQYEQFCKDWFFEARRITKKLLITPGILALNFYPQAKWIVVISKPSSVNFSRLGGYNCWEPLLVYDSPVNRIPRDLVVYDSKNFLNDGLNKHPCPDNLEMVKWIVQNWSKTGDLVLDCFAGIGTTAVACKELGRNYIGIEISQKYVDIANQRLAQTELLNPEPVKERKLSQRELDVFESKK